MEGQIFQYGVLAPGLLLLVGIAAMAKGVLRQSVDTFKIGLYWALSSFFGTALLLSLRVASGVSLSAFDIGLLYTSIAMFLAVSFSISYVHIHRILPDFFINSSLVFSLFCLFVIGANVYSKDNSIEASQSNPNRFIESDEYQLRQQKANATYASQVSFRQMPQ